MPVKTVQPRASILEVTTLLKEAFGLFHQRSAGDTLAVMNDTGLTMPQMVTLFILRRVGPRTVCDIADRLRLSRAATSHLVDRLVHEKLVERAEDHDDRRQKRVSISSRGVTLLERFDRSRRAELADTVERLSPELRRALGEVLRQIIDTLKASEEPLRVRDHAGRSSSRGRNGAKS